eukprot:9472948-Pyramimonas_sp.AAC.1
MQYYCWLSTVSKYHQYSTRVPLLQSYCYSTVLRIFQRPLRHYSISNTTAVLRYTALGHSYYSRVVHALRTIVEYKSATATAVQHDSTIVQHPSYSIATKALEFGDVATVLEYYTSGLLLLQHYSATSHASTRV